MKYLDEALISYSKTDVYPFHMPGHKRQGLNFPNPYTIDITEIDGFDNLHHAEDILKEAQERAAALYGSDKCYYLVNGSTCGLLAAICGATKKRDKVLVARNSHKAVYHALFLNELDAEYLYPAITGNDLQGQITPEQVKQALTRQPDSKAVVIASPTYEGIVSDIAGIAKVCHAAGVPLIVDSAHGAHLGLDASFPENTVNLGADAVIMSLHKTLPSFTQTALLHLNGTRIAAEAVERYLGIFETSSPSYLFMAGMDACIREVSENGKKLFADYRRRLDGFYQKTADLKALHVMRREDLSAEEAFDWDDSKLVIFAKNAYGAAEKSRACTDFGINCDGEHLHHILLEKYHLQMEMVSASYVLGMTSIMDTDEGFERLSAALHEIDAEIEVNAAESAAPTEAPEISGMYTDLRGQEKSVTAGAAAQECLNVSAGKMRDRSGFTARMYQENRREMQIYEAMALPAQEVPFSEAEGKISADYVYLYPPGIPLIVPGEVITGDFLERIKNAAAAGLSVEGQRNLASLRIKIVYF